MTHLQYSFIKNSTVKGNSTFLGSSPLYVLGHEKVLVHLLVQCVQLNITLFNSINCLSSFLLLGFCVHMMHGNIQSLICSAPQNNALVIINKVWILVFLQEIHGLEPMIWKYKINGNGYQTTHLCVSVTEIVTNRLIPMNTVHMWRYVGYRWNDHLCSVLHGYICEANL